MVFRDPTQLNGLFRMLTRLLMRKGQVHAAFCGVVGLPHWQPTLAVDDST